MRAIQCFSSVPLLQGRQASGLYVTQKDISLPRCVLLCMELSALQWRRLNGPITLYTDTPMRNYLAEHHLLNCWDKVNTKVLDSFYRNCHSIDFKTFWSAGKFACYERERAPFVCIDTDLVVWKRLSFSSGIDFGFAHWERIEPEDESYPDLDQIQGPPGYEPFPRKCFAPLACNMAISYFGNDQFRKELAVQAMSFMKRNHLDPGTRYAVPEILYMEQRLPLAIAKRNGLTYAPVLECTWSPKNFRIVHPDNLTQNWFFSDLNTEKPFTHLWFHKKYLAENEAENRRYCAALKDKIHLAREGLNAADKGKLPGNWNIYAGCNKWCSRCSNIVRPMTEDPDVPAELRSLTQGRLLVFCQKYSNYTVTPPW